MPHMSPISWTIILLSSITFVIFLSSMIYFSISYKKTFNEANKSMEKREIKWEW